MTTQQLEDVAQRNGFIRWESGREEQLTACDDGVMHIWWTDDGWRHNWERLPQERHWNCVEISRLASWPETS